MNKPGLFSRTNTAPSTDVVTPQWDLLSSLLFSLRIGDKIPLCSRRSQYEEIREKLKSNTDYRSKDTVSFIDFVFKHEKLGNVAFLPEAS